MVAVINNSSQILLILGFLLKLSDASNLFGNKCEYQETCGDCIQTLGCVWCSNPITLEKENDSKIHCLSSTSNPQNLCAGEIINPETTFEILENQKLDSDDVSESVLQISPQRVRIKMRMNEEYNFKFVYQQPSNYPLDLYYIMDISYSMKDSKRKLVELGNHLIETMREKTNNFRIGFGSFVDKVTLPYVNTHPDALKSPCENCAPPVSFRNDLSLTNSSTEFSRRVERTRISGNIDSPEGGLDAIMQAMVCHDVIGWRQNARHLVVLSTDATPHIAGDGKLGGVIEPHDLKCHMEDNLYTEALRLDYPSVSQINYVARENNMNLIFAILGETPLNYYRLISASIQNSKVGMLQGNSNNVVQFISEIYDEIKETVKITSNATEDINIKFDSKCGKNSNKGCSVKPGHTVDFSVNIKPTKCSKDLSENKKYIKIKPEGLKDSLIVELEVICDCKCSKDTIEHAEECNYQGNLECGICKCSEGRFGRNCQCDKKTSSSDDIQSCIKPGDNEVCSGQGSCLCGNCICNKRNNATELISGKYCDCNNFSCKKDCSGHGTCKCGVCECNFDYKGDSCDCAISTQTCREPKSGELCSGHGECQCGQCTCFQDNHKRIGQYCEECVTCPSQKCDEFRPCVECQAYKSGIYNESQCKEFCTKFETQIVKELSGLTIKEGVNQCQFLDVDDCTIKFEYRYDEVTKTYLVEAPEMKKCPEPISLWYVLILCAEVIGSILLVGLLTLIGWKQLVTYHDKKEYAKFETEKQNSKWNEKNPIYKEVKSTFTNPVYGREED